MKMTTYLVIIKQGRHLYLKVDIMRRDDKRRRAKIVNTTTNSVKCIYFPSHVVDPEMVRDSKYV